MSTSGPWQGGAIPSRSSREQSAGLGRMSFSTDFATREQPLRLRISVTPSSSGGAESSSSGKGVFAARRQFLLPCVPSAPIASLKARIASILGQVQVESISLLLQDFEIVDEGVVGDVLRDDDVIEVKITTQSGITLQRSSAESISSSTGEGSRRTQKRNEQRKRQRHNNGSIGVAGNVDSQGSASDEEDEEKPLMAQAARIASLMKSEIDMGRQARKKARLEEEEEIVQGREERDEDEDDFPRPPSGMNGIPTLPTLPAVPFASPTANGSGGSRGGAAAAAMNAFEERKRQMASMQLATNANSEAHKKLPVPSVSSSSESSTSSSTSSDDSSASSSSASSDSSSSSNSDSNSDSDSSSSSSDEDEDEESENHVNGTKINGTVKYGGGNRNTSEAEESSRRLSTPPGGWVAPGNGTSRTKRANKAKRERRQKRNAEAREASFAEVKERAEKRLLGEDVNESEVADGWLVDTQAAVQHRAPLPAPPRMSQNQVQILLDEQLDLPPGGGSFGIMPMLKVAPQASKTNGVDAHQDSSSESESESESDSDSDSESDISLDESDGEEIDETKEKVGKTKEQVAAVISAKPKFEAVPCPSQRNEAVPAGVRLTSVDCQEYYVRSILEGAEQEESTLLKTENGALVEEEEPSPSDFAYQQFIALGRAQLQQEKDAEEEQEQKEKRDKRNGVEDSLPVQLHPDLPMQFGKMPNWNGQEAVVALPVSAPAKPPTSAEVNGAKSNGKRNKTFDLSTIANGKPASTQEVSPAHFNETGELDYGEPEEYGKTASGSANAVANGTKSTTKQEVNGSSEEHKNPSEAAKLPTSLKTDLARLRELRETQRKLAMEIEEMKQKQASQVSTVAL